MEKNWADWKANVKKRMYHNKRENKKTGGGEYNQYVLSDQEETIARICAFYTPVDGIDGGRSFGELDFEQSMNMLCNSNDGESDSDKENEEIDFSASTSKQANSGTITHSKRRRTRSPLTFDSKRAKSSTPRSTEPLTNSSNSVTSRQPSPKRSRPCTPSSNIVPKTTSTPKGRNLCNTPKPDFSSLLSEENKYLENICRHLEEHKNESKIMNDKLDRLCNILEKKKLKMISYTT